MEIKNTTKRPIKVPLPGGKRLFLGLGGTGQIAPRAAEHPPVKALIESGDLEVLGEGRSKGSGGGGSGISSSQGDGGGGGNIRRTGDR